MTERGMKFSKFTELVARIWSNPTTQRRDPEITIVVHSPGSIGPSPSVEVEAIHAGFDWDAGQVMIYPAQPLTTLTPEQVEDITTSVRKGLSWHAFEAYKKHKAQLENAALEHGKVAGQRDKLLKALTDALEWIDAVPPKTALPAMPGFDRDEVNNLISSIKGGSE
ncbi:MULTISPECIES: hypothetical protein [Klebsiella pneumoniae complex]|uniref:hypothetical protein n=1 Tax=Klebsiella pneumoniae complex TaxID=3390273 RepID=UPI001E4D07E4|nr:MULTISPECIES: hypothetical protein [Klebsiella]MEC6146119.1 hypothetical protein [Klebsiella pneumoniae]